MKREEIIEYYFEKYKNHSNERNNTLVIMVGVPGSGKTTTAKILEQNGMARISTDDLKSFFPEKNYTLGDLFALQYDILETLMNRNIKVIADSNSDKQVFRNKLIELAQKHAYQYSIIYCYANKETIYRRMEDRKKNGNFYVDKAGIDKFFKDMEIPKNAIYIDTDNNIENTYEKIRQLLIRND